MELLRGARERRTNQSARDEWIPWCRPGLICGGGFKGGAAPAGAPPAVPHAYRVSATGMPRASPPPSASLPPPQQQQPAGEAWARDALNSEHLKGRSGSVQ